MTRAEVLAEYLGLAPETHPECYKHRWHRDREGGAAYLTYRLALPDPLAPGTAADAWLGVLVRSEKFRQVDHSSQPRDAWEAIAIGQPLGGHKYYSTPVEAIVRAMMAADPAFREKMEGAEG